MRLLARFSLVLLFPFLILISAAPVTSPSDSTLSADDIYAAAQNYWAAGDQTGTESVLAQAIRQFPRDTRFIFFEAACVRSRFDIPDAAPLFMSVAAMNRFSPQGEAALLVEAIDERIDVDVNFNALDRLASQNPKELQILWMDCVACRTLNKNEIGAKRFQQLLKKVDPGPVLVHQTYANILDELKRYDEALIHRQLAVKLEPEAWSYEGLANTLTKLKRWDEADAAYEKCTSLSPGVRLYWINWADSKRERGDEAGARQLEVRAGPKP